MEISGQPHATAALPPGKAPSVLVGPRIRLDAVEKRTIALLGRYSSFADPATEFSVLTS
jgi:hypothetical protein